MTARTEEAGFADFETVNRIDDCRVWCWGIAPVTADVTREQVVHGLDVDSFLEWVQDGPYNRIYFHNLAFDGDFILSRLLRDGWVWNQDELLRECQFSTVISEMGQYYTITVLFPNGRKVVFADSLKKLPLSISALAATYGLAERKLEIDYDADRPEGYEPTTEEWRYLDHDIIIGAKCVAHTLAEGNTKLTIGSDSLAAFKRLTKGWEEALPVLDRDVDDFVRGAYRGGWTFLNERYARMVVCNGDVYDNNSIYPWAMRTQELPYGQPIRFEGRPDPWRTFIVEITLTATIRPGMLPCIQIKNNSRFAATEYLTVIEEPVTLIVTNIDLELWHKHYDLKVHEWHGGFYFRTRTGLFNSYIDHYMAIKAASTGGARLLAKLHLNSLYGKFATRPEVRSKRPILENGVIRLVECEPEVKDPVYTPVSVFVTAYARRKTITAAQAFGDDFVYADTDSVHVLRSNQGELVEHPSELGLWKHEYSFTYGLYWRAKCYIDKRIDGVNEVHIAGMPRSVASELSIGDFEPGRIFEGKLASKRVPGGVCLLPRPYELKV